MAARPVMPGEPSLRIDKLLFFLRLAKSRSLAQKIVEEGHIRLNGRRVLHTHSQVRAGDMLTLPSLRGSRLLRIQALPTKRGPAMEAAACYADMDAGHGE